MPLSAVIRVNPAVWMTPILTVIALFYSSLGAKPEPYLLAVSAAGINPLFVIAPVSAACAAWEGGRLRRSGWLTFPHVRSPFVVALAALAPAFVMGVLALTATLSFKFIEVGIIGMPDARVLLVALTVLAAHVMLGFAIGINISPVISVPAVFFLDFGWMLLPPAQEPLWLRHLTGALESCCFTSSTLAPSVILGSLSIAGGFFVIALLLIRQPLDRYALALALIAMVASFGVGSFLVSDLGAYPIVPRDSSVLVCSESSPQVCVWPEHVERLPEVVELATQAAARWQEAGFDVPEKFSEQNDLSIGKRGFGMSTETLHYQLLNSLAYSLLPDYTECPNGLPYPAKYLGEDYILAWLDVTAQMPEDELAIRFDEELLQIISEIQSLPVEQQQLWIEHNKKSAGSCDIEPLGEFP